MIKTLNLHVIIVLVVLATLIGVPTLVLADHSWLGYHWGRKTNPFTLKLGDNVSESWDSSLAGASVDWSQSSVLDTTIVAGTAIDPHSCYSATSGRVEVCNDSFTSSVWLGVAWVSVSADNHITKGVVQLNDAQFDLPYYNTPEWRNFVMCQEIGHTLGLAHQDEEFGNPNLGSCMDYTNSPADNQHPNLHDYEELITIYSHRDRKVTVKSIPAIIESDNATPTEREQWGALIEKSPDGRLSVYMREFVDGSGVLTLVIWALEKDRKEFQALRDYRRRR